MLWSLHEAHLQAKAPKQVGNLCDTMSHFLAITVKLLLPLSCRLAVASMCQAVLFFSDVHSLVNLV